MKQHNYCLVGPMGAGKSTIGRLLAKELRLNFKDSDKEIEERTGASIPLIFDLEGEQGFRDREEQVIADLVLEPGLVLATGGGAVMRETNRQVIKQHCRVIYLHTSVENQLERTAKDRNRPLLQTENPRQVLGRIRVQARAKLGVHPRDAGGGLLQTVTVRIFANCQQNFPDGPLDPR